MSEKKVLPVHFAIPLKLITSDPRGGETQYELGYFADIPDVAVVADAADDVLVDVD